MFGAAYIATNSISDFVILNSMVQRDAANSSSSNT
jgi:hypothetical protein